MHTEIRISPEIPGQKIMLVHLGLSQANSLAKFVFRANVILSRGQRGADGSKGQAAMLQLLEEKGVMAANVTALWAGRLAAPRAKNARESLSHWLSE